ncbi:hypothetical protein DL96DRAFT_156612 [Flagelloscypha sp. PMI_526]|nr:hypothetical protein DL96DRAFT_156612 [Flagelloscypha sp. PMI_526]
MGAFDTSVGGLLLGFSFDMYLYGFVSYQYLNYKIMKFDDPIWLRTLVAILFVVDTSQTVAELYAVWHFAVKNYTNPIVLSNVIWGFLISRIYRFTRQFWLCIFLVLTAVIVFLCGAISGIRVGLILNVTNFVPLVPLSIAWLAIEAGVDIAITVVLSRALWRSKTGFARTNTVVNRCIRAAIQSGLFSSVFALATLVVFTVWTTTYLYAIFGWPLGRTYSNSLLYTLVARKELAEIANGTVEFRDTVLNSFPMPPQTFSVVEFRDVELNSVPTSSQMNSIHNHRETATDSKVVNCEVRSSPERYVVFSPPSTI